MVLLPLNLIAAGQSYWTIGAVVASASVGAVIVRAFAYRWLPLVTAATWLRLSGLGVAGALLGYALMPPGVWLVPLRFIQGLGFGLTLLVCMACIGEQSRPQRRTFGFALAGGAISIGLILGPTIGFYLSQLQGNRFTFLVCAASVLTSSLAIGRMRHSVSPSRPGNFSWNRSNQLALLSCILSGAILGNMESFVAIVALQQQLGNIPLIIGVFAAASIIGRFLPGLVARRIDASYVLLAGTAATSVAVWAVGVLLNDPVAAVVLASVLGLLVGVLNNASITFVSLRTPVEGQASALGVLGIGADLGLTAGAAIGSASMALSGSWTAGMLAISAALAILAVLMLHLKLVRS